MSRAPWQSPSILFTLFCVFLAGTATGAVTMWLGFPPEKHKPRLAWNEAGREIFATRSSKKNSTCHPPKLKNSNASSTIS